MTMTDTSGPTWRGRAARRVWMFRLEVLAVAGVAATAGLPLAVPATRRRLGAYWRAARTRRLLLAGFGETRIANAAGRMPRIRRVRPMPFGERVEMHARAGHWANLFEVRAPALAAALRAASVRVDKDPDAAHKITLDVVRLDPLAAVGDIPWLGLDEPTLSMWEPVHVGMTEMGTALLLDLVERGLLAGGLPGSGKSTFLRLIAAHAAKSPDAHLILIDPNRVQFAPWRDRALAYASNDPAEALAVLTMVQSELDRRLDLLVTLPGVPDKVTREISREHGLPLWVLMVDELAYHTSIVGTGAERAMFAAVLRDIVARGRAAGIIPVVATQRPTADIVPTSLSGLFGLRLAFNVTSGSNSDVILGEGWAKRGWNASEIPLTSRGVGLLLAEGAKPQKFKAARISTEMIADLSLTTIPLKPHSRPGLRVVADVA
jgi:hypothetical protein